MMKGSKTGKQKQKGYQRFCQYLRSYNWLKIQDYFQSGGTTLPEYTPGGITKSELAWRLQWTKNAIINQHARGGIT